MIKPLQIVFASIITLFSLPVNGQHQSFRTEPVICYSSNKLENTKIKVATDRAQEIYSGRTEGENVFELTLNDVPSAASSTIFYATEVWSSVIDTPFPIKIFINWVSLEDRVLGSARPGSYETNFVGAPLRSIAYPIALAERLAQKELNEEDDFEIFISLNKEYTWYYGTDGNPLPDTHDLLSVVLHEIGHGLGLADTFSASSNNGSYGTDGRPNIYDFFVVNDDDLQLVDLANFPNYSSELYRQLTSNKLFTGSTWAAAQNAGENAKLYTPSEFNGGSSISHLDEAAFPAGDINSLMSPQIGREEVIHQVGPISQAMLAQMGYVYTFISHDTIQDQPNPTLDVIVNGSVASDSSLLTDRGFLYYSVDDFETTNQVPITYDVNNSFTATIPAPMIKSWISYYFEVEDVNNKVYRLPAKSQLDEYFRFGYGLITGVGSELKESEMVSIYPNPSNGSVSIELSGFYDNVRIEIINLNGKVIEQWRTNDFNEVYKRKLPAGYYVVQVESSKSKIIERLLIR